MQEEVTQRTVALCVEATKLSAARIAMESGCDMVITNGARPEDLYEIVEGQDIGTRFLARKKEDVL